MVGVNSCLIVKKLDPLIKNIVDKRKNVLKSLLKYGIKSVLHKKNGPTCHGVAQSDKNITPLTGHRRVK